MEHKITNCPHCGKIISLESLQEKSQEILEERLRLKGLRGSVYNASTGNTLETENTERALQMCTKARHPDELPIYLEDLWPKAQKKVLEFLGIKTPQEANLDVLPLFMLPKPE